jgi:hypothetical protein
LVVTVDAVSLGAGGRQVHRQFGNLPCEVKPQAFVDHVRLLHRITVFHKAERCNLCPEKGTEIITILRRDNRKVGNGRARDILLAVSLGYRLVAA